MKRSVILLFLFWGLGMATLYPIGGAPAANQEPGQPQAGQRIRLWTSKHEGLIALGSMVENGFRAGNLTKKQLKKAYKARKRSGQRQGADGDRFGAV